jgi:hypothetical protein
MSGEIDTFVWPEASTLVQRAERSLNIVRAVPLDAVAERSIADMRLRMTKLEQGYHSLVPPGYESGRRLGGVKRTLKKLVRPLMWWYVEPRWIVQQDLTADLAAFASSSIRVTEEVLVELRTLRSRVQDLERQLADQGR